MMRADAPTILPLQLKDVNLRIGEHRLIKDISCTLGAGNITAWAQALPGELAADAPDTARGGAS